jgi:hypothetical protein
VHISSLMLFDAEGLGRVAVLPEGGLQHWQGLSGVLLSLVACNRRRGVHNIKIQT